MLTKKYFLSLLVLSLVLVLCPKTILAQDATFYFSPSTGTFAQGESFWLTIMVDTKGVAVNAVGAYLTYPQDKLEALGVSTEGSVMTIWAEKNADNGEIEIAGGLPTPGFSGVKKIIAIGFKAKVSSGSVNLKFSSDSAVITDAENKNILSLTSSGQGNYSFKAKSVPTPPETPTEPTEPEIQVLTISEIQVSELTKQTALVSWTTNLKSGTIMDYGVSTDYGLTAEDEEMTQEHSVLLSNLDPGTLYHFKVKSIDAAGEEAESEDLSFVTQGYQAEIKVLNIADDQPLADVEVIFPGPPQSVKISTAEGKVMFDNLPLGKQWISIKYKDTDLGFLIEITDQEDIQKFEVRFKLAAPKTTLIIFIVLSVLLVGISLFTLFKIWVNPKKLS